MAELRSPPTDVPRVYEDEPDHDPTKQATFSPASGQLRDHKPFLKVLRGKYMGQLFALGDGALTIGRARSVEIFIDETTISRHHAKISKAQGVFVIEDLGSANGTLVNGARVTRAVLRPGDQITIGPEIILKFEYHDPIEESAQRQLYWASHHGNADSDSSTLTHVIQRSWSPDSWKQKPAAQQAQYDDPAAVAAIIIRLARLPPLVTSWEIEELKRQLAEAEDGTRFLLQGGDCAETLRDCDPTTITNKLKILLQMSLVLVHASHCPVIRVGRFAGQYAKPRSRPTEIRQGVELPSYFGDLVNRPEFTVEGRRADPHLLLDGYQHAAMTINFIRALSGGGFADLQRPEYYDLSFFDRLQQPASFREEHKRMARNVAEALHFVTTLGKDAMEELTRAFFTSHEGLNLVYESAQTRKVPRREGYYDLTTHFPWIGERTRALDGAHIEFFRGVLNPVGVKLGPTATPEQVVALSDALNPENQPGKLVFIARMGVREVTEKLPPLIEAMRVTGRRCLWVCDPMHGNMIVTKSGLKTRNFDDILREVELSIDVHGQSGTHLGGVHFELTGDNVTECIGSGISEADLDKAYLSACDPRLNYLQALEMAFCIARRVRRFPSVTPPPKSGDTVKR